MLGVGMTVSCYMKSPFSKLTATGACLLGFVRHAAHVVFETALIDVDIERDHSLRWSALVE